jgi:hypothetical protein
VPALPTYLIEPIWDQFAALLPLRAIDHPLAVTGTESQTGWSSRSSYKYLSSAAPIGE